MLWLFAVVVVVADCCCRDLAIVVVVVIAAAIEGCCCGRYCCRCLFFAQKGVVVDVTVAVVAVAPRIVCRFLSVG